MNFKGGFVRIARPGETPPGARKVALYSEDGDLLWKGERFRANEEDLISALRDYLMMGGEVPLGGWFRAEERTVDVDGLYARLLQDFRDLVLGCPPGIRVTFYIEGEGSCSYGAWLRARSGDWPAAALVLFGEGPGGVRGYWRSQYDWECGYARKPIVERTVTSRARRPLVPTAA